MWHGSGFYRGQDRLGRNLGADSVYTDDSALQLLAENSPVNFLLFTGRGNFALPMVARLRSRMTVRTLAWTTIFSFAAGWCSRGPDPPAGRKTWQSAPAASPRSPRVSPA